MKKPFKDPCAIKTQHPKDKPVDGKPYPLGWDHCCPQYDQRHSIYTPVGTDYGVGHNQPVGHKGNPVSAESILPSGAKGFNAKIKY
jgi:hypothetical protein